MRDVLARYWVVVHVALLAAFLTWVHGGTRVEHLGAVPWLSLAVIEFMLILPPTRKNETLDFARYRTARAVLWDPLLYIGVALSGFLLFQYLNGGCKLVLDAEVGKWVFSQPPVRWGPFCINPQESRQMLYWFPPAFALALGVRHGMNRRGKLYLLRALVVNSALLSLFGVVQMLSGTGKLFWITPLEDHFFASFGYDNHAGAFFTLLFVVNGGLFIHAMATEDERKHSLWLGLAMLLNLVGGLLSLSRAAILLSAATLVLGGFYGIRHAWRQISNGARMKALAIFMTVLAFGFASVLFFAPGNPVLRELRTVHLAHLGTDTFGARWYQTTAAWRIWRDYPWFGVGGWGYRQYVAMPQYLEEGRQALFHRGAANVHNDVMQFLVEHGAIGLGLMLGAVAMLLVPVGKRLWLAHESHFDGWSGDRWLFFRLSPITVMLLVATSLTFVQSLIDLPFRSPAILVTWTIALACAPAFLPAKKRIATTTGTRAAPVSEPEAPSAQENAES